MFDKKHWAFFAQSPMRQQLAHERAPNFVPRALDSVFQQSKVTTMTTTSMTRTTTIDDEDNGNQGPQSVKALLSCHKGSDSWFHVFFGQLHPEVSRITAPRGPLGPGRIRNEPN